MPTYIALATYTQKGVEDIKGSPKRLDAFKDALKKANGELKSFHLTMGRYDIVLIYELPDDEAAAKVALNLGSLGSIRTETLRAFTEGEYRKIVGAVS
jgi:uncharacterized protein with GYD domain